MCLKYPLEIASAINKTSEVIKTISVENYLEAAADKGITDNRTQDPLKLFEEYSTFHITVIEKRGEASRFARANLPITELARIDRRTQIATQKIMEAECTPQTTQSAGDNNSAAYNQIIRVGAFKGSSPAQVLIRTPDKRDKLAATAQWLSERMDNHEGNRAQYDAIMQALELFDKGQLKESSEQQPAQDTIQIYQADYRPLKSTKRDDGKIMTYSLSIQCQPSYRMPYQIRVINYWAEFKDGTIAEGSVCDEVNNTIRLSESEWDNIVESMLRTRRIYENCYGKYELERAMKADRQNRLK